MKIIGLTGPTGSGKSTVATVAEENGFFVINCDSTAREVTEPNSPLLPLLCEAFGEGILFADGTLNRKELAKRAFCSKKNTELLNSIMLPFIAERIKDIIENLSADGVEFVLLDAPTLFESGLDSICDLCLAVLCPENIRKKRIIERDNLTEEQANIRLAASKPDSFYCERTKHILVNDGELQNFLAQISEKIGELIQ